MATDSDSKKIVHVHLPGNESLTSTLTAGKHHLTADEPKNIEGGKDQGPDPYDYLLMALGSCTVMTVKMYADRKGWVLKDLFVELRHNRRHAEDCKNCDKQDRKLDFIELELIVKGNLTNEQLDKLLEISKKCPVHKTLTSDIRIDSMLEQN